MRSNIINIVLDLIFFKYKKIINFLCKFFYVKLIDILLNINVKKSYHKFFFFKYNKISYIFINSYSKN